MLRDLPARVHLQRDAIKMAHVGPGELLEAGKAGVTRITVYYENGEMAPVPWVRIEYENGHTQHMAARSCTIWFGEDEDGE
jgi:hypothetical protein